MREPYAHVAELSWVGTDDEAAVRSRIDAALDRRWQVLGAAPDEVAEGEVEHAARLVVS